MPMNLNFLLKMDFYTMLIFFVFMSASQITHSDENVKAMPKTVFFDLGM